MNTMEHYVYKKEVDWSLLHDGLTLPVDNQVIFGRNMDEFLKRGESKDIILYLDGKAYKAKITNVNFSPKFNRIKDTLQIRYSRNSELSKVLRSYFSKSYGYLKLQRALRSPNDRSLIIMPEEIKEYLAIYTTEDQDSYFLDTIIAGDIFELKEVIKGQQEKEVEANFNYEIVDNKAGFFVAERLLKIRKLNKKICDNLKLLYDYHCQICGKRIGEEYSSQVVEAHHIDYFVKSFNNDFDNQLIVCPNHHSIIHDVNPIFDRSKKIYTYPNGFEEGLILNKHL